MAARNDYKTIVCQPAPSSGSFTNSTLYRADIDFSNIKQVKDIFLRFGVQETSASNDVNLTDVAHFVREIRVREKGRNEVYRSYPDALYWETCTLYPSERQSEQFFRDTNLSREYYERDDPLKANTTRYYRLPLLACPWDGQWLNNLKSVFTLEIEFKPIIVSGSGVAGLADVSLEIHHRHPSAAEESKYRSMMNNVVSRRFLQPVFIEENSKTLTASTTATIDLSALEGTCAALLFMVRSDNYSATGSADKQFLHLGHDATVDIISASGDSLYAGGQPVRADLLLGHEYSAHGLSELGERRAIYLMPFCSNLRAAYSGQGPVEGMYFDKSKIRLELNMGSAGTATVQTITCTNAANDAGHYNLAHNGDVTDNLAAAANAATIKSTLEALPSFKQAAYGPMTVTASAALTTTATLTFGTNTEPQNSEKDQVRLITSSLNDGGVFESAATATSTTGVSPGWLSGSSYSVTVLALMHRVWQQKGGVSKSLDL